MDYWTGLETDDSKRGKLMEQFLTIEKAALRLKMKPNTIRHHIRIGKLPGIKHGDSWSISATAIRIAEGRIKREKAAREAVRKSVFEQEPEARRRLPKWVRPALD